MTELAASGVDSPRDRFQTKPHPGRFEISEAAVCQIPPVLYLCQNGVRDSANREVGVCVPEHDVDLARGVELPDTQGGAGRPPVANDGIAESATPSWPQARLGPAVHRVTQSRLTTRRGVTEVCTRCASEASPARLTHLSKPKTWVRFEQKGPYGIRTRAAAVRGRCPRPLDEWAMLNPAAYRLRHRARPGGAGCRAGRSRSSRRCPHSRALSPRERAHSEAPR